MVIKPDSMRKELVSNMRGGKGQVEITHLVDRNLLANEARLFAKLTLKPGTSIGPHRHENEFEVFFVLSGRGIFYDNDNPVEVQAGDVCLTMSGETHSIENNSSEDLVLLAVIILLPV
ncbi:MAG: cupin domain-containing protein [Thermotoga caldifontis]|uniref:cupin domain-containing protein n=1 Tax=Thermotoga caldifontis TaxID=1508419 RepID=UPI003C79DF95